jgi:hypothetical protein
MAPETKDIFVMPVPLASMAFGDGWAPMNLILLAGNTLIMLAMIYISISAKLPGAQRKISKANNAFGLRYRQAACALSVIFTLLMLATVVATQNPSLAIKPIDDVTLWLLAVTAANAVLLIVAVKPNGATQGKHVATAGRMPGVAHLRRSKGTWVTDEDKEDC